MEQEEARLFRTSFLKEVDDGISSSRIQSPSSHSQSGKSVVGGSFKISTKINPKSKANIDNNNRDPLDKACKKFE